MITSLLPSTSVFVILFQYLTCVTFCFVRTWPSQLTEHWKFKESVLQCVCIHRPVYISVTCLSSLVQICFCACVYVGRKLTRSRRAEDTIPKKRLLQLIKVTKYCSIWEKNTKTDASSDEEVLYASWKCLKSKLPHFKIQTLTGRGQGGRFFLLLIPLNPLLKNLQAPLLVLRLDSSNSSE